MTSEWKLDRRMRLLDMHAHLFCMADRNGKTTDENMLRTMAEWETAIRPGGEGGKRNTWRSGKSVLEKYFCRPMC